MERTYVGYAPNAALGMGTAMDHQKISGMQNSINTAAPMSPVDERLSMLDKIVRQTQTAADELENRFNRVLGSGPCEPDNSPPQIEGSIIKMPLVDSLDKLFRDVSKLNSHLQSINSRCQL